MMNQHGQVFRDEAAELLVELENALLELEEESSNPEPVDRAFRALHTIKGSGAMFGFDEISAFAHGFETAFDIVREGRMPVTGELISAALKARDHLQELLESSDAGAVDLVEAGRRILSALPSIPDSPAGSDAGAETAGGTRECVGHPTTYWIRFRPPQDCFLRGMMPLLLLRELQQMGMLTACARLDSIPPLREMDPELCYSAWDLLLTTPADENAIQDVFIFVADDSELAIDVLSKSALGEKEHRRLGEILSERGDISPEALEVVLRQRDSLGESPVEPDEAGAGPATAALTEQEQARRMQTRRQNAGPAASVRVLAEKLDALVNIVGEIVTLQARMSEFSQASGDPTLTSIAEEMERLTEQLRDDAMSIRMQPIGPTFGSLKRLVRDLSLDLGKEIGLTTSGEETELDKTVIERLADPLVHVVRNAIDHGIERPDVRRGAGKEEAGRIHLSARHDAGFVVITVEDDGAGLDRDVILKRALERGLVDPGADLSDSEVYALILQPGFSTAEEVTEVSGRGVGMDVVNRTIDELRGSLKISSRKGKGTKFRMQLPLTLAIIEGLLVEVGTHQFVVPMANIVECIELLPAQRRLSGKGTMVNVRGELVGCLNLREHFEITERPPAIQQVVVAETRTGKIGFTVDRVVGDHQTVIKNLGSLYRGVEHVSGATILGNGSIALILDLDQLAATALQAAVG